MNSIIFYISEHKQLVRLLFSDHGDPGFRINFCLPHSAGQCRCGRAEDRIMMQRLYLLLHIYIVSGCMAVIRQWITGGFQESEEEVSLMLEKLSASTSVDFAREIILSFYS